MKHTQFLIQWIFVLVLSSLVCSCAEDKTSATEQGYGYVQFTLVKTTTRAEQLDYLNEVRKIRVDMTTASGDIISHTLAVGAGGDSSAEFGMTSDKWMLQAGDYLITGYELYDNLDRTLLTRSYDAAERQSVQIVPGGVSMSELLVSVKGRGFVKFRLVKDSAQPVTRVNGVRKYPFHVIYSVDVRVKSLEDNEEYEFKGLKVNYKTVASEQDPEHITGVSTCDSLLSLPAGRYRVVAYRTFFDKRQNSMMAEFNNEVAENGFVVTDNRTASADVPVTLDEAADYIKDAYSLYQIWLGLDGPNWSYRGTAYPKGCNWEFEGRDIDLWLAQPGVKILENGRVAMIDFEGFGAKGEMPAALGQLTELRQLYMGNHNSETGFSGPQRNTVTEAEIEEQILRMRTSFAETYCLNGHPLESFSPEMQLAFELNDIVYPKTKKPLREFPVHAATHYVTQITSLDNANLGNLKKLQTIYIAFSPIKNLPDDLKDCEALTDLEIFACPDIEVFPDVVGEIPKLNTLIFSSNPRVSKQEVERGLRTLNTKAANIAGGSRLQALQLPAQQFDVLPDLTNLKRLGLLNIQSCKIKSFEKAFGKEHYFSSILAGDNELSSLPTDDEGYFMGLHSELEAVDFSFNRFTELPNIFDGESLFTLRSVSFANNQIVALQGAADGSWRGIRVEVLALGFNRFAEFPRFFTNDRTCSRITYLQLQGNRIETFGEEVLDGDHEKVSSLTSLDLSMNKLTELPSNFSPRTLPYLFGLDLSYNRFDRFQYKPLNCSSLTSYIFRGQRDAEGNRCMKEWPSNVSLHKGLRVLCLGSNDIRKVDDQTISYLIYNLEILDNPNIVIDLSDVCRYIKAGMFRLAYDADQDIRGCDALELN